MCPPTSLISMILCVILLLLNPTNCCGRGRGEAVRATSNSKKALFIFGDSLFDAGNNQYYTPTVYSRANHHPYGMSYISATGRCSDGLLVPDFIAEYAGLPLIPPVLDPAANGTYGYNFASAGSGVLYHADVMNFDEQQLVFENVTQRYNETMGEEETTNMLQNGVYMFSTGGNDYFTFATDYPNATNAEKQAYVHEVITKLTIGFKEIYEKGGRKFVIQDIAPLGCFPIIKNEMGIIEGCYEEASELAVMHNVALRNALSTIKDSKDYSDLKYGVFDYYNQLLNRMRSPTDYGLTISEIACCGIGGYINGKDCGTSPYFLCTNPSSFVLFDGAHPTQPINVQISMLMWNGGQNIIAPYNVQQLFEDDEEALGKA